MLRAFAAALLLVAPLFATADAADELLARVEKRNAQVRDLEARFTQSYRSGALGRELVETGVLKLKRPGRMRWEYQKPEQKLFVSDGKTWYFYVPAERQVVVREQAGDRRAPALLLAGGSIAEQFAPALEVDAAGRPRLRLRPRAADPDLDRVYVDLDASDRIIGLEVHDAQGNISRFRFEELRENRGLADELFRFRVPQGVEVIAG
ncbi:MAG: outer membrane lipoprotein chaperone LolA [Vicinamibacteria bacterium]|jgi:outer membrane lipoprotein carrier protein|nr:outer membrane lipoprotein chaperone LolA [Vicinamibacteria bacterium]